ncbi:MAG: DsbA family oxidoreductase [Solirubrobacteraceae bacterium]
MDVDIWSDVACPWCYIGKRRFEAALESFEHRDEVQVHWHSFELDPNAPPEREGDYPTHLERKYGITREDALAKLSEMTELAAQDGLELHFERARGGNTFDAHRLLHLALAYGRQDAMKERLMRAYQTEGEVISDHATLRRLALEVGLPEGPVDELLAGDRYADEVRTDEYTANRLGINAVPFFVVDRALGAAGAQPPEHMLELLRQGWEAQTRLAAEPAAGERRDSDGR